MNRSEILNRAREIITGHREQEYGKVEDNFSLIANLWSRYLEYRITAEDVALMMTLFKLARIKTGVGTEDSFVDACGYLALAGEIVTEVHDENH